MSRSVALGSRLTLEHLRAVARGGATVVFDEPARASVRRARAAVERILAQAAHAPVYGVNTGFGALADKRIAAADLAQLQLNLVRSHAAGVGAPYPTDVVRGLLLLRAQVLALGHSGVREELVDLLVQMLNRGVHPVVPSQGSVGASGDLAPLAHLALVVIGEGEAEVDGMRRPGAEALAAAHLAPLALQAKEGLALVNGTQAMAAQGGLAVLDGFDLCRAADCAGALSLEVLLGTRAALDERIFAARAHPGAFTSAANLRRLTAASPLVQSHVACEKVQDPYSLRCMAQVHGAVRDALAHARDVVERELNAATDNPLVFPDGEGDGDGAAFLSGGNFHGAPVAMALDYACLALPALANISDRRVMQLLDPVRSGGLPPFLTAHSGLCSGLMMAQVTGAALASECKGLATPASIDSIPTSANQEDHVSMGPIAAAKLARVVDNVRRALAVELLCAAQAADLREPLLPGPGGRATVTAVRGVVPRRDGDRPPGPEIEAVAVLVADGALLRGVEQAVGRVE
ncbi:MAG TPA: histidine ammonia-lyase [Myxococcota bacterium]|jgi:histidine ammonia-lyase|nr:histidine ammonia-lyase [Myxococcota bacterium]